MNFSHPESQIKMPTPFCSFFFFLKIENSFDAYDVTKEHKKWRTQCDITFPFTTLLFNKVEN